MEPITHPPASKNPEWNESYYFVFYDKANRIGGMSRVGFKPNKPEGMTFFFLFLPDGSAAGYHATDRCENYPSRLRVEQMSHISVGDGTWKYVFDGSMVVVKDPEKLPEAREKPDLISDLLEVKMDVGFRPIHQEYEYSEHMTAEALELGKKSGDKHWEQIAKVNGLIRLGDAELHLKNVIGQRDHTHGIRDWTGVGNWFYFVIWFNDRLAVNPAAIMTDDGRLGAGGFLFQNGKNIPLREIRLVKHELRKDALLPAGTELELIDARGKKHRLVARPGSMIPLPFLDEKGTKSILVQSFGQFELDGTTGGYGSYETLKRTVVK
ncbi:MAG: hypothetical protein C4K47_04300 [Candidatus Thorarchaeota archaeon]|nr:MAG: hypothetical protein C4K47_04300 [Candidatus Thorarchaeota archaeon]